MVKVKVNLIGLCTKSGDFAHHSKIRQEFDLEKNSGSGLLCANCPVTNNQAPVTAFHLHARIQAFDKMFSYL
jgi:hypothetical protein